MFEPTSSELRIDRQFSTPEEQSKGTGFRQLEIGTPFDVDKTYPFYAVANAKEDLKGKNLKDLLASTQQDDDIWKPATMVNHKKFLMSSQDEYTITQDPEQDTPVKLVRAAAKIKLNISSTVKDYHISDVQWKPSTTTPILPSLLVLIKPQLHLSYQTNNTWSPAASAEDERGIRSSR